MATFKKKELNELVGGDISAGGGDKSFSNDSEIETGPVQKGPSDTSDYEKGQSTTTDRASRYRQNIPWFAVYSYGGTRSNNGVKTFESALVSKNTVEEKIDDLVKKSKSNDVRGKDYNPKVSNMIDDIADAELSDKQIKDLEKAIKDKKKEQKEKIRKALYNAKR